jgi:hypothetical protein
MGVSVSMRKFEICVSSSEAILANEEMCAPTFGALRVMKMKYESVESRL